MARNSLGAWLHQTAGTPDGGAQAEWLRLERGEEPAITAELASLLESALGEAYPSRALPDLALGFGQIVEPLELLHAFRTPPASIPAGLIAVAIAIAIGVPICLLSGYLRGQIDQLVSMRLTDAIIDFPSIAQALALAAPLGGNLTPAMLAIGIGCAAAFIRLAGAQAMSLRKQEFVEAARALGNRHLLVMRRHALPNIFGPLMVQTSLAIAGAILAETALSFLGLGVQPPTPSWGSTLRIGTGHMQSAPLLSLYPGLQIFATVLGIIRLGDRLRDMLNPRVSG